MLVAGIAGLAIAIFYGSRYLGRTKGTDEAPTPADSAAARSTGSTTTSTSSTGSSSGSVCTDQQRKNLADDIAYTAWRDPLITELNRLVALTSPASDDLTKLTTIRDTFTAHLACLRELKASIDATATTYSTLQTRSVNIEKAIEQAKLDVQIAKDRAALALNPNLNRSYYDGWFPLERPLKHMTYPFLIGFGLFFCSIAFFFLMAAVGIDVTMLITVPAIEATPGTQLTGPFWIMGGISTILLGLTIYGFLR